MRLATLTLMLALSAAGSTRTVATDATSLRVPVGWHAVVSRTPDCDPIRLIVASSAPLRITANGAVRPPAPGNVIVLLLEDRLRVDRPENAPRRPAHFSVGWDALREIKSICGNPKPPAYMTWFRARGRYLGFIIYPVGTITPTKRAATLRLMDSLRVASR